MPKIRGILAKEGEKTGSKGEIWGREGIESLYKQIPESILVYPDGKAVLYVTLEINENMRFQA